MPTPPRCVPSAKLSPVGVQDCGRSADVHHMRVKWAKRALTGRALAVALAVSAAAGPAALGSSAGAQTPDTTAISAPPAPEQRSRTEIEDELDTLRTMGDQVQQALDDIDVKLTAQQAAAAAAGKALADAQGAVDLAQALVAAAEGEAVRTEAAVKEMAIDAYLNPPGALMAAMLASTSAADMYQRQSILGARAQDQADTLSDRRNALDEVSSARDEAAASRDDAKAAADTQLAAVADLEGTRAVQEELASDLDLRIQANQGEIASLDAAARQRQAEIDGQRVRLALLSLRLTATTVPAPAPTVPGAVPASVAPPAPSTTRAPTTSRPPGTTVPPVVTIPPLIGPDDVTTVDGFVVNKTIAGAVGDMLQAASAAGLVLGGGGYRSPDAQVALRRAHCGPTLYDIYERPASQCTPPTARPGQSMHEQGLAIDFTCSGVLISSQSGPCWNWLATNAATYGFFNLPSEPWHWSVNGR